MIKNHLSIKKQTAFEARQKYLPFRSLTIYLLVRKIKFYLMHLNNAKNKKFRPLGTEESISYSGKTE